MFVDASSSSSISHQKTHNPYFLQLLETRQKISDAQEKERNLTILNQKQEGNDGDDDFALFSTETDQSKKSVENNNKSSLTHSNKELIQKLEQTSTSIPPLLVRSFSSACPQCSNNNNNNSSSSSQSYWCDARSLCGFCYNCFTFSCPLPSPVIETNSLSSLRDQQGNTNKQYYQKMMAKLSNKQKTEQQESPSSSVSEENDRSLRLWAALKLTHDILKSTETTATLEQKIKLVQSFANLLENQIATRSNNNNNNHNYHLPWQGYDISLRAFPDSPREPVVLCIDPLSRIEEGTNTMGVDVIERPHQALKGLVDQILLKIVEMNLEFEKKVFTTTTTTCEYLSKKKLLLESCLKLISVVNNSCDFDELGFETLMEVAKMFNGVEDDDGTKKKLPEKIERRLKILYLSQMKLEPRDLVGESFCWKCMNPICCICQEGKNTKTATKLEERTISTNCLSSFGKKKEQEEEKIQV